MDTDKIKIYGARVRVDSMAKVGGQDHVSHTCILLPSAQQGGYCTEFATLLTHCTTLSAGMPNGRLEGYWIKVTGFTKFSPWSAVLFTLFSLMQVAEIEAAERGKMREKCEKIISHGINCFINRQLIYNFPEEIFADAGIMAIGKWWLHAHAGG
jgi:hypothetical protein